MSWFRSTACLQTLPQNRHVVWVLLVAVALLAYANSLPGAFIQDDLFIVKNNPLVQSPDLYQIFTSDYWRGMENSGLYRPLTILSFALNRMLTGSEPWGFHCVNVVFHAGATVLVWLVLSRWGLSAVAALLSALLFALHPIHGEVVNEVIGRSELLVANFALLALILARSKTRWSSPLILFCFALALLSKEHAVVVLFLIPLADIWFEGIQVWRRRFPLYAGLMAITAGWLLLRHFGVEQIISPTPYSVTAVPLAYIPWEARVLTALQYQWVYLAKLVWPSTLQVVYTLADLPPIIESVWSLRGGIVAIATTGMGVMLAIGWRDRRWWALPAAAYVVAFAPTANVLIPIGVTMAERLAYFPSVWFCGLLGAAFSLWLAHAARWRRMVMLAILGYMLSLGILLVMRNRDFVSEIALWQREVLINEKDFLAWHSYAQTLANSHRYDEAEQAYLEMLRLEPDFPGGQRSYYSFLFERGRFREAIAVAERTLALSREQGDETGVAYDQVNLAAAYLELRDFSQAVYYLEATDPKDFQQRDLYYGFLGIAYQGVGNHQAAAAAFEKIHSFELNQNIPLYHGISLFNLGRYEEAEKKLREALRINDRPEAWNLLGTIAAQSQRYDEAIKSFSRAVELAPNQNHYQENLERAKQLRDSVR